MGVQNQPAVSSCEIFVMIDVSIGNVSEGFSRNDQYLALMQHPRT